MRILLTGANGFVGARIADALDVVAAPSLRGMGQDDVRRMVDSAAPDVIIHTAAMSDIGACQRDPEGSYNANVLLPVYLARTGVKCVMFSTDQVYSGCAGDGPYAEDDVCPANLYARHKLDMENRTLDINPDTVHLRATWMYDMPRYGTPNRGNFLMNMLIQREGAYSSTQMRGLTYVRQVAILTGRAANLPGGAYNFGSENDLNMLSAAMWLKNRLNLPILLRDGGEKHNLCMDTSRLRRCGICFDSTVQGLERCIHDYHLDMQENQE